MNTVNLAIITIGLGYLILLMYIFFSKKNVITISNKVYKIILVLTLLISISDLIFWFSCFYLKNTPYIVEIIHKVYLTFLIFWFVYLGYYIIIRTNSESKLVKNYLAVNDRISFYPLILSLVLSSIQLFLPLEFNANSNGVLMYATGYLHTYLNVIVISTGLIAIISFLIGIKDKSIKKIIPLIIFVLYELFIFYLYLKNRDLCLFTLSSILISCLIYHVSENPDIKYIEQLEKSKLYAEKMNDAKSNFLIAMSQELRTPLNTIVGLSQVIQNNNSIDEMHGDSKDILTASVNLLEIVNGISDINEIDTCKLTLIEDNYKPLELFDDLVKLTKVKIGSNPVELRTNFSNDLPYELYGDSDKIKRILTNFLTNAVKYTNEGYIEFIVECSKDNNRCNLSISIKDTGIGIKNELKNRIFSRFSSEEDKDNFIEGTGLGLTITKGLAEIIEAKIEVDSTYGSGSCFTIRFTQLISKEFEDKIEELPDILE